MEMDAVLLPEALGSKRTTKKEVPPPELMLAVGWVVIEKSAACEPESTTAGEPINESALLPLLVIVKV